MSGKRERPVQFLLSIGGTVVNQCCYVDEDELEAGEPADRIPALLERAQAGRLPARTLSRYRDALLEEAVRTDNADALACVMPRKRMDPLRFTELMSLAEKEKSPDVNAWLLSYRGKHYSPAEFDTLAERQLDLELGLAEPDEADLRRLFRLRYLQEGVNVCGFKKERGRYEIPARIGGKPVVGTDAAAFYALDPMPHMHRAFSDESSPGSFGNVRVGDVVPLGRGTVKKGAAEAPLSWRVLRREDGRMLALCESPVAMLPYHPALEEVSWESCALRRWLNTVFLPLSFTEGEREHILPARVETPDNPNFGTPGGNPVEDRLFLLSAEEASALLPDDAHRALGYWWWLRTPGFDNSFAAAVTSEGAVVRIGSFVDTDSYAVRPAVWIKAE